MNLKEYIKNNNLFMPNYNKPNIMDLVKYLYGNFGVNFEDNKNIEYFKKNIPIKKHTLFILIDGMGSNLIDILDNKSILKKNKIADMTTVSPSSTGCVLTSLATAKFPNEHGIIGWYCYNRKFNTCYYPLLFVDRKDEKSLKDLNIKENDIFIFESKFNQLNIKTNVLYPSYISDSVYSKYVANDKIRKSYNTLEDAFNQIMEITIDNERTFTYLYIPDIDSLEHNNGFDSKIVLDKIKKIEFELNRINNDDLVIVITADHGQTNINIEKDIIMDFDKYNKYFYAYPGIDFGMATYYVNKDMEDEFVKEFNKDFKNKMYLFKTEEFINNGIFGVNNNNDIILSNLGEYISLCNSDSLFINSLDINEYFRKIKGNHSGLSKDEMIIPLIVIDKK